MTIAHEYGHHVQGVTGLFYARAVYLQDHPDQKLESSRRNELQASCFAGVFSKAVEKSYPLTNRLDEFEEQSSNSFGESPDTPEDERTHGLATSQGFWILNGFNIGADKGLQHVRGPGRPGEVTTGHSLACLSLVTTRVLPVRFARRLMGWLIRWWVAHSESRCATHHPMAPIRCGSPCSMCGACLMGWPTRWGSPARCVRPR